MAKESGPADASAAIRADLLEVCRHHREAARHQQDVRDRLFVFYHSGAWGTLVILWVLLAVESRWPAPERIGPWAGTTVAICGFAFVGILGLFFLAVYLFQVVNSHLHYLAVAGIHEYLDRLHRDTPGGVVRTTPFAFAYGRYRSLSLDNRALGRSPAIRLLTVAGDLRLRGADFWANCISIFFVSVSVGGAVACAGASPAGCAGAFLLSFSLLLVVRQFGLAVLLSLATKDHETRWPAEKDSGRRDG